MAYTQAQLTALESAIAQGASSCEFEGKKVQFRNLEDMEAIRQAMRVSLGLTKRTKRIRMKFYKGLTSESGL